MKEFNLQLIELSTGRALHPTGKFVVTSNGSPIALATYDANDALNTVPLSIVGGKVYFRTVETVNSVDIFGYTDTGYAVNVTGVKAGEVQNIYVDTANMRQTFFHPINFSTSNTYGDARTISASAENLTGMYLPNGVLVRAEGTGVHVTTAESGKTIDVGLDGSGSGIDDADGFLDGITLASTGYKAANIGYTIGTNNVWLDLTGGDSEWTSGALFHPSGTKHAKAEGTDAAAADGNGIYIYASHASVNSGANTSQLSYTFAGTPTAVKGYLRITWDIPTVPTYA